MKQNTDQEEVMVNYLLGALPEAEQLRLEERFFTDDEYYQQLLALEDELRYDYAAGGMPPEQRAKFERRLLSSPQTRRQVELASAVLGKVAEKQPVRRPVEPAPEERKSLWQSWLAFFSFQNPALQFSLAAAATLLFVGAAWLFYQTGRLRAQVEQLELARAGQEHQQAQQAAEERARQQQLSGELERERGQRAQLEQELARQKAEAARAREQQSASSASFLSFALVPGLVRDVDGMKRLTIPAGVNQVRLRLTLNRPGAYPNYRAVLQTLDGAELWTQNLPRANSIASGRAVAVNLPAKLLPPGDYVLALKGQSAGGAMEAVDEYYFSVVRP
jgi:hypothetical protein